MQNAEYECFDVRETENISRLEKLVEKLGGLDILVISAGFGKTSKDLSWEIDHQTVQTNVNGFVEIANWSFNFFLRQDKGNLATISSIAANRGIGYAPAYSASKSFQSIYCEALNVKAKKLKSRVAVTCIEAGFIKTDLIKAERTFWIVPVEKAVRQMVRAIDKRKRKVYISRRWWIIAKVLRVLPWWLFRRI